MCFFDLNYFHGLKKIMTQFFPNLVVPFLPLFFFFHFHFILHLPEYSHPSRQTFFRPPFYFIFSLYLAFQIHTVEHKCNNKRIHCTRKKGALVCVPMLVERRGAGIAFFFTFQFFALLIAVRNVRTNKPTDHRESNLLHATSWPKCRALTAH